MMAVTWCLPVKAHTHFDTYRAPAHQGSKTMTATILNSLANQKRACYKGSCAFIRKHKRNTLSFCIVEPWQTKYCDSHKISHLLVKNIICVANVSPRPVGQAISRRPAWKVTDEGNR